MKKCIGSRVLSLLLVLAILWGFAVPANAGSAQSVSLDFKETSGISPQFQQDPVEEIAEQPEYAPTDVVRVSIVMDKKSTLEVGYSTANIVQNAQAMSYRAALRDEQAATTARIERAVGTKLDVQWNLTLAANIISANVTYGDIETIQNVPGVQDVFVETRYEPCVVDQEGTADPNMATSRNMIGTVSAYAAGYTGAGTKVAIIDTGLDMDHQCFDDEAFAYSLSQLDGTYDCMDTEDIAAVLDQLNAKERTPALTAQRLYKTSKIPYGYNYVDKTPAYVDHNQDTQGGHGSHVAGIAVANSYVPNGDGTFSLALDTTYVQGVAPDAQVVVMKVFGKAGGAFDSDYLAAIEDAIVLGCASINLSLGSSYPGFSRSSTYQDILDGLVDSDAMVVISAGNAGHWAQASQLPLQGYLYGDDVSMHTGGSPGTFTNSLCVASVDNAGITGIFFQVAGKSIVFQETEYSNVKLQTLAGEQGYIFIDGTGTEEDFGSLADVLKGKVAICSRGGNSFYEKAEAAVKYGAIATVIYNNQPGVINMDLSTYTKTEPCVSITQEDGDFIRANSTPVKDGEGNVLYYTGTMDIDDDVNSFMYDQDYDTMSSFSSYGVPGTLEMKPEISAPGGSIYSVDGTIDGGTAYVTMSGTSMAAPQVAGMAALVAQYIQENGLDEETGLSSRALSQSLLMSTAKPMVEESSGNYYPVIRQGAGLANVGDAVAANSYILMDENATQSAKDGKVKVELLDDPEKTGVYEFGFTLNNLRQESQQYVLSSALFTQDLFTEEGLTYLDTETVDLMANVTWTVDGKDLTPDLESAKYDVTGDKLVNGEDVQAILDYVLGKRETIGEHADLNGDGEVTSYDAYLLLQKLGTGTVTLPAGGKLEVAVKFQLTEDQKARLDESYRNGAYVQGFVFAQQLTTAEGVEGTAHSIPVLGFYGNWTDATMFDRGTFIDRLYGDTTIPYAAYMDSSLKIKYAGSPAEYYYAINPYMIEETYPAGRGAIRSDTIIYRQIMALIRNSSAVTMVATNENGEVLYMDPITHQNFGAFYYVNGGSWQNVYKSYTLNKAVSELGGKEDETITVSVVAIPELYEKNGSLTEAVVKELIESGQLGRGAFLSNTFKVDDTAPEVTSITKDLLTGNLTVTAQDNNYIAAVQVLRSKDTIACASATPVQEGSGEMTTTTLDLADIQIGAECIVLVADYAGNVSAYTVEYGGEEVSSEGRLFAFTNGESRGYGKRWIRIDPDTLYYNGESDHAGLENMEPMDFDVTAAEYVNGNVYMAGSDHYLYVGTQDVWNDCVRAGYYGDVTPQIKDLAFHYQNQTLYALGANNDIFTIDLITCEIEKVAEVTVTNPATTPAMYKALISMTIDDDGNFYLTNYGNVDCGFLYTFTLDDVVDGKIIDLAPVGNSASNAIGYYNYYSSMAWDHENDVLYMSTATTLGTSYYSYLVQVDPETGKGEPVNKNYVEPDAYQKRGSKLNNTVTGLYIVPPAAGASKPQVNATSVELDRTVVRSITNSSFLLSAEVYPWMLEDKSVTWSSSNESVATVSDGLVTTRNAGTATITVTTNAEPRLTATCELTVESLDTVNLSALVYDGDDAYWADFTGENPSGWEAVSEKADHFLGGTVLNDVLYVHDGSHVYAYDADCFQLLHDCGAMDAYWLWSAAAPAPAIGDLFDMVVGICGGGVVIELVNPEEGTLRNWSLSRYFYNDPMAAIAYCGTGTIDYPKTIYQTYYDCPANFYYIVTESGDLWKLDICTYDNGTSYGIVINQIGNIGLNLSGASQTASGKHTSMVYDEGTGYLLLSSSLAGETTQLYAIDPENKLAFPAGDFGDKVYPVVSMYQYERIQELTVKLIPTSVSLNEGDTQELVAHVLPMTYQNQVTWTTSDAAVASVDENGCVTALKEGTATITATTVEADAGGGHATASCTITVKGLASVSVEVGGQIVTDEGTKWATIDTGDMSTTISANAETTLTGAGYHDGKIYGTNSNFTDLCYIYQVDPENGFAEDMGGACVYLYAFHDATTAPAEDVTLLNETGESITMEAFGYPAMIVHGQGFQGFGFLTDYVFGYMKIFGLNSLNGDIGALAYLGDTTYELWNGTVYQAKLYYALGADGTMYQLLVYANYDYSNKGLGYTLIPTALGNIGQKFEDPTAMTMTYVNDGSVEGLVIGSNGEAGATLYFVDLTQETLSCSKIGTVPGVSAISGLYVQGEQRREANTNLVFREGTDEICSSARSFAYAPAEAEISQDISSVANQMTGSTNTVATGSAAQPADGTDGKTITVEVTAKNAQGVEVAATNGVATVEFDGETLELTHVVVHAGYKSVETGDGTVKFAYANSEEIAAGQPIATLTFQAKPCISTDVTMTHHQVNEEKPSYEETMLATTHKVELRNAKEATCTEAGYTGDEICTVCGKILKQGEEIPAHCASSAFTDLDTSCWYHEYTDYVLNAELMEGMGNGLFAPNGTLTRGMLVTTLYRMAGEPQVGEKSTFTDVAENRYYSDAVAWAQANGIAKGVTDTAFCPEASVTREQAATFLYRYVTEYLKVEPAQGADLSVYQDSDKISGFAKDAVAWATAEGLFEGFPDGTMQPRGTLTRAQTAKLLTVLDQKF